MQLKFSFLTKQAVPDNQICQDHRLQTSSFSHNWQVQKLARHKVAKNMCLLHNAGHINTTESSSSFSVRSFWYHRLLPLPPHLPSVEDFLPARWNTATDAHLSFQQTNRINFQMSARPLLGCHLIEELEEVAGEGAVWASVLRLLPLQNLPWISNRRWMNGCPHEPFSDQIPLIMENLRTLSIFPNAKTLCCCADEFLNTT